MITTYTVIEKGKSIATKLTKEQVKDMLGIKDNRIIYNYSRSGTRYKGRYELVVDSSEVLVKKQKISDELLNDWENMRQAAELIRTGKGRIVTRRVNGELVKYVERVS